MNAAVMTVRLWFTGQETEAARLYCKLPKSRNPEKSDEVWLPLSQIEHVTRYPAKPNEWPEHVVTIPEWLAQNHDLL